MNDQAAGTHASTPHLRQRWEELKAAQPGIRQRDAAERLGVSEVEIVAMQCGDGVRRLAGPWTDLVQELPSLGTVMTITRNESIVHEKTGKFGNISVFQNMGLVLNEQIDLRIFFNHWYTGFAVEEETRSGHRRSLQFYDADGTAVHKVYLVEESDHAAFDDLVARKLHVDQSTEQQVSPRFKPPGECPDEDIDKAALRERWRMLQDPHDFHAMLQELRVSRMQALRFAGGEFAYRVPTDSFRIALEQTSARQIPVMVFAGSPGVIQIHTGTVCSLKRVGPWYNVLDPGFNLHLREDRIASAWIVRKPSAEGTVTSLEIFDAADRQIAWLFGERKPGKPELESWRLITGSLENTWSCG